MGTDEGKRRSAYCILETWTMQALWPGAKGRDVCTRCVCVRDVRDVRAWCVYAQDVCARCVYARCMYAWDVRAWCVRGRVLGRAHVLAMALRPYVGVGRHRAPWLHGAGFNHPPLKGPVKGLLEWQALRRVDGGEAGGLGKERQGIQGVLDAVPALFRSGGMVRVDCTEVTYPV